MVKSLKKGADFGDVQFLTGRYTAAKRTATVVSVKDTFLAYINVHDYYRIIGKIISTPIIFQNPRKDNMPKKSPKF